MEGGSECFSLTLPCRVPRPGVLEGNGLRAEEGAAEQDTVCVGGHTNSFVFIST